MQTLTWHRVVGLPALAGLASIAVLLGVAGCGGSGAGDAGATTTVTVTETEADSPTAASGDTAGGTASDSPSSTPSTSPTAKPNPMPTTAKAHATPWSDPNADFGFVSHAEVVTGGVRITFDRATWLQADEVKAWNQAHPDAKVTAADDYALANQSKLTREFLVRTGAAVFGSILLSDQPAPKKISLAQFAARVNANPEGVTCWLYHRYGGLTGDVIQVEEQYRP